MNIRSAELLNQSLQNLADNFYRNRALQATMQEESQRNAVEQSFRNAMMQHYANIEERQADTANKQMAIMGRQSDQSAMAQKQEWLKTIMGLNATGQLDDGTRVKVNKWLSTDPDFGKTGLQLSAPANPSTAPALVQSALSQGIALRGQVQQQYDAETDPAKRAAYGKQLDDIDGYLGGKGRGNSQQSRDREGAFNAPTQFITPQSSAPAANSLLAPGAPLPVPNLSSAAPAAAGAKENPPPSPDPRDVQWLGQNPTPQRINRFENIYGPGSSSPFLNPPPPTAQQ